MKKVLTDLKAEKSTRAGKDWDLTEKVCRDVKSVIKSIMDRGELTEKDAKRLQPSGCHAPRLTGLPKVHKPEVPLRGVVSTVGSPYDKISKLLVPILRSLQGRTGLFVRNSRELKERVSKWRVERSEVLVSYDVKNLYPSIPIAQALELVQVLLMGKPDLLKITKLSVRSVMDLLKWTFNLFYCEYSGEHYILKSGPIGLGATGEIAIIYMEEFQLKCLKTLPHPCLQQWYWYVDDSEVKCEKEEACVILDGINAMEPGVIEFTMEEQNEEGVLPVLDLKQKVDRKSKKIRFGVHYKPTHTNINVKATSNHPDNMKRGVIKGFIDRAKVLCDDDQLQDELKNIEDVFVANGYNRKSVKEIMTAKKHSVTEDKDEVIGHVRLPYIKGFSEQFKKIAKKHRFGVTLLPGGKLKSIKSRCQIPLGEKRSGVVYQIPCGCGAVYTGETKRRFETRCSEHKQKVNLVTRDIANGDTEAAMKRMDDQDGGLAKHNAKCSNVIEWEKARIVLTESRWYQRKVLEGFESIRVQCTEKEVLNTHYQLETWKPFLYEHFK